MSRGAQLRAGVLRGAARVRDLRRAQLAAYLTGCLLFSLGASFFIHSDLGTDPLDVFSLGLLEHTPLTIGVAQALVAIVCIAVWALWNRRRPVVSPFLTFFFCGSVIDLLRATEVAEAVPLQDWPIMLVGVLLCAYGSSLIIMSGIGIRAMDLVAITMTERWHWPFWAGKGVLEVLLLAGGWLMGGPVGAGTVCFLVFVDTLIQPLMRVNGRLFRMPNFGIPGLSVAEPTRATA